MDGAWNTALVCFRRRLLGILSLTVGAVAFTTLVVAVVTHWMMPSLLWAACAALEIDDETLYNLERDLDFEKLGALSAKGKAHSVPKLPCLSRCGGCHPA